MDEIPAIPSRHAAWLAAPPLRLLRAIAAFDPMQPLVDPRSIAELAAQTDVARFLELVRRHRVTGVASVLVRRISSETGINLALAAPLAERASRVAERNMVYHLELERLRSAFNRAGIAMHALKGTALSWHIYGDIRVRHLHDIDIFVAQEDALRAWKLMAELRYTTPPRDPRTDSLIVRSSREITCRDPARDIEIDLHWRFEGVPDAKREAQWHAALAKHDAESEAFELLYLCVHGAAHGWSRLKWLGEVCVLFHRLTLIKWQQLRAAAESLKLLPVLAQTLLLLHWLFAFELDDEARAVIRKHRLSARRSARLALEQIRMSQDELEYSSRLPMRVNVRRSLRSVRLSLFPLSRYRPQEIVRYLVSFGSVRAEDVAGTPLPPPLHWLYPLIRVRSFWRRRSPHASKAFGKYEHTPVAREQ